MQACKTLVFVACCLLPDPARVDGQVGNSSGSGSLDATIRLPTLQPTAMMTVPTPARKRPDGDDELSTGSVIAIACGVFLGITAIGLGVKYTVSYIEYRQYLVQASMEAMLEPLLPESDLYVYKPQAD
ncbi:hypothetical protein ACHHYP_00877 [Achlya hypogyna]|uniref:Secreted protein n=1 Tax=Achlya hypogyna TaxID=1202772 RepID=A0A1V9ZAI2_ACHHY|nr:hypothetical protein ACHHYP_00877 [Achlya hypogyna]